MRCSLVANEMQALKGQCNKIFCFWFFFTNQFPPSPRVSHQDRFKFFPKFADIYSQIKVHHRYQRHRWQIYHRCQEHHRYQRHRWQIYHQCQRHRRQILPPVSRILMIPVANLPPESTIPAANLPPVSTTPLAICHRYQ